MARIALMLTLLATALICALPAGPARAQPIRVYVALTGDDANPCTFASPCKSAQHAHDVVKAGGEMRMLDQGSYGLLTITKSISIQGDGHGGIAAQSGGTAITVNGGASDIINLRGLIIDGFGSGNTAIQFNSGGALDIQDCIIRHFGSLGINITTGTSASFSVLNTTILNVFANDAIRIQPIGTAVVEGSINQTTIRDSGGGIILDGSNTTGATLKLTILNSDISHNINIGVAAQTALAHAATSMVIRNSSISHNGTTAVNSSNGATSWLRNSTVSGNARDFFASSGGTIFSFGDNDVVDNATNNTAVLTPATLN